jgi:folylpolyglutamate synthase
LESLAHALHENDARPDHVIFTTYQEREDGSTRIGKLPEIWSSIIQLTSLDKTLKTPETPFPDFLTVYSELWKSLDPQTKVSKNSTIEGALKLAKRIGDQEGGMLTLVTGSLHLVGGALNILCP